MVRGDILTHELADDLRGGTILLAAGGEELLAKLALDAYAETRIFHDGSVADGYTSSHHRLCAANPCVDNSGSCPQQPGGWPLGRARVARGSEAL